MADYRKYGLIRNPFPLHGSFPLDDKYEERYAKLLIGRDNLKELLRKKLENLRAGESSAVLLLLGDYGTGKTHCLKFMQHWAIRKYRNIIPLYFKGLPGPKMRDLLRTFLDSLEGILGRDYLMKLASESLNVERSGLVDTKNFLLALASKNRSKVIPALRWAKGYGLSDQMREKLGLVSDLDESVARDVLSTLLEIIWEVRGTKTLLLIDEVEELLKYDQEDLYDFYSGLRNLIDTVSTGMMMVLASTPSLLRDEEKGIAALNPALNSRISDENTIILSPLDSIGIRAMIISYLREFRIPSVKKLMSTYPFTEEAINLIADLSRGIPRNALMLASIALREALSKGKKQIDDAFIRTILELRKDELADFLLEFKGEGEERRDFKEKPVGPAPVDERTALKVKVIKILEELGGVSPRSRIQQRVKEISRKKFYRLLEEMRDEGMIDLIKVRGGYRVVLK